MPTLQCGNIARLQPVDTAHSAISASLRSAFDASYRRCEPYKFAGFDAQLLEMNPGKSLRDRMSRVGGDNQEALVRLDELKPVAGLGDGLILPVTRLALMANCENKYNVLRTKPSMLRMATGTPVLITKSSLAIVEARTGRLRL